MKDRIRKVLNESGGLTVDANLLEDDADLYQKGLKSIAVIMLLVSLEQEFDLIFPENVLHRNLFHSIQSIEAILQEIIGSQSK